MKSLYVAFLPLEEGAGISRKILSQYSALKNNGLDIDFCVQKIINGNLCYVVNDTELIDDLGRGVIANARTFYRYGRILEYIKKNKIQFVYLRYALNATPSFVKFLNKIKRTGALIYMEIPTFPYDGEMPHDGIKHKFETIIERYSRPRFKKYIDKVVTFSLDEEILGIQTIQISNAVDSQRIKCRNIQAHNGINMIAVAMLNFWHGYDRLIMGLYNYYQNIHEEEVTLYIIGKGNVLQEYKEMVRNLGLENHVVFKGVLYGEELDEMFDIADVGIGSLGRHRNNITQLKTLKNVEYAVRGIPFIYSENNPDFDNKPYVYKVCPDETDVNIKDILAFLHSCSMSPESIRESVVCDLSWDTQMRKVINTI